MTAEVLTARHVALSLSEADFMAKIIDRAVARGWKVYHPLAARTSKGWRTAGQGTPEGYPDLTLAKNGRVVFAECKSQSGRLRPEQADWLAHLNGLVWRPDDWEAITALLDGEA